MQEQRHLPKSLSAKIFNRLLLSIYLCGGDVQEIGLIARRNHHDLSTITNARRWVQWQAFYAALAGIGSALALWLFFPLGLLALPIDIIILLWLIGRCCWGVGAIYNCPIDVADPELIFGLWSKTIKDQDLPRILYTLTSYGAMTTGDMNAFSQTVAGYASLQAKAKARAAGLSLSSVESVGESMKVLIAGIALQFLINKMGPKAFAKLTGFLIPYIGAVISGVINWNIISSIGQNAITYYQKRKELMGFGY